MGSKATRFSKANPAKGGGRKPRPRVEPSGKWNEREVFRLAVQSVEAADIAVAMGLTERLAGDRELAAKFEEVVARGHAQNRIDLARTAKSEAFKGKSNALRDMLKTWIPRYADDFITDEDERGLVERGVELVKLLKERQAENQKGASQ
jgi:hypothetical protein